MVAERTGLLLDPYFSGTKLALASSTPSQARGSGPRAATSLFGTVDTYLIWRMTGGRSHATDATNASRTLLYNIREGAWDEEICRLLDVPLAMLPEVKDCAADFGTRARRPLRAAKSPSSASRATSRPPPWGRPASSPA